MKILFFVLLGSLARGCAKNADNLSSGAARSSDNVALGTSTSIKSAIARVAVKSVLYRDEVLSSDDNISYDESTEIITLDNTK